MAHPFQLNKHLQAQSDARLENNPVHCIICGDDIEAPSCDLARDTQKDICEDCKDDMDGMDLEDQLDELLLSDDGDDDDLDISDLN